MKLAKENFNFHVDWENVTESPFDVEYDKIWRQKMKKGIFRYTLNIEDSKEIIGKKHSYFVQLNVNRAILKRPPQLLDDIRQSFDESKFNFTKISKEEIVFTVEGDNENSSNNLIIINVSPLEEGHTLLVPSWLDKRPQILTEKGLSFAIKVILSSNKPSLRAGFNGILAFATINHLHLHAYNLNRIMSLEKCPVRHLIGNCYVLDTHPSKGFAFQITKVEDIEPVVQDIVKMTELFLDNQVPHNLYITRGVSFEKTLSVTTKRDCLRIFLWARTPSPSLKDLSAFNPALCELFGHFLVKDPQSYAAIDEHFLETTLTSLTEEPFKKVLPLVKSLFRNSD